MSVRPPLAMDRRQSVSSEYTTVGNRSEGGRRRQPHFAETGGRAGAWRGVAGGIHHEGREEHEGGDEKRRERSRLTTEARRHGEEDAEKPKCGADVARGDTVVEIRATLFWEKLSGNGGFRTLLSLQTPLQEGWRGFQMRYSAPEIPATFCLSSPCLRASVVNLQSCAKYDGVKRLAFPIPGRCLANQCIADGSESRPYQRTRRARKGRRRTDRFESGTQELTNPINHS